MKNVPLLSFYTKDDSGMMTKLVEMLKNSECGTLREKMILVMNTFICARQMGECEAYFKIFPDMKFKDSNVTTVFVPTSKKELRSKFMIRVEEDDDYNGKEKKKIHNKEGWFVEKYDVIDKYTRRDKSSEASDAITPSQFLKMYNTSHTVKAKKADHKDLENKEDEDEQQLSGNEKFHYVMTATKGKPMPLPDYISIENPFPGEPAYMKKRTGPAVLRFHKPKQSVDPAAYFFCIIHLEQNRN
jgi:hypothetical protein